VVEQAVAKARVDVAGLDEAVDHTLSRARAYLDELETVLQQALARGRAEVGRMEADSRQQLATWRAELDSGLSEFAVGRRHEIENAFVSGQTMFEQWELRAREAEAALDRGADDAAQRLTRASNDHRAELASLFDDVTERLAQVSSEHRGELERVAESQTAYLARIAEAHSDERARIADENQERLEAVLGAAEAALEKTASRSRQIEAAVQRGTKEAADFLEHALAEHEQRLNDLAASKTSDTRRVAEEHRAELESLSEATEKQVASVLALVRDADDRLGHQLTEVQGELATTRDELSKIIATERGSMNAMAERANHDLDEQLARRAETVERLVADRMSAIEFAVDEARRGLEADRTAQAAELDKAARRGGAHLEKLLTRVRDVEATVMDRLGTLERRTVESGAVLEELLARVGEIARASNTLTRAAGETSGTRGGEPRRSGQRR
jgi:hypothetical protein